MTGTMLTVMGLVAVVAFAIGFVTGAGLTIKLAFQVTAAQAQREAENAADPQAAAT